MEIKVLGPGCCKCKELEKNVLEALSELGVEAEVEKVEDIERIVEYGVMMTPALVVDGEVKVSGRVPDRNEIKKMIAE